MSVFTLEDLQKFTARGWKVFPLLPNSKEPWVSGGFKAASSDPWQLQSWLDNKPNANWGLATGEKSGVWVLDLDDGGEATLTDLLTSRSLEWPKTYAVRTQSGGMHLYFQHVDGLRNLVRPMPGVDVRTTGGYVVLPGSTIDGRSWVALSDAERIGHAHEFIIEALKSRRSAETEWSAPSSWTEGVKQGGRDKHIFKVACSLRRRLNDDRAQVTRIVLELAANCEPPFPEDLALRKVEQAFEQDHTDFIELGELPFLSGDTGLPEWLDDADPQFLRAVEKSVMAANVREASQRIVRAQRAARHAVNRSMDGAQFVDSEDLLKSPLWGAGNRLMWVDGEGLLIASDQGLGKTLTAQQLLKGRLGLGPGHLLGLPITPLEDDKLIVYLAMDRPAQAARSMARLFTTPQERETARRRVRVWRGPLPVDITTSPDELANFLEGEFGPNVGDLIGDSVKDYTPGITKDEVGSALNVAWQEVLARGINVVNLHHERKTGGEESRGNREPSLDNIYGSVWITSGQGSVLHIKGKQGENIVTYTQLKFPLEPVPALMAMHDQEHARTEVLDANVSGKQVADHGARILHSIQVLNAKGHDATISMVVEETGLSKPTVQRYLKGLLASGAVTQITEAVRGTDISATYRANESLPDEPGDQPATPINPEVSEPPRSPLWFEGAVKAS